MRTGNAIRNSLVTGTAFHPGTVARLVAWIVALLLPAAHLQADTPPFVLTATARCGLPFELDVEFDEYVDPESATDPFNYTVFQTSSNGAPYMRGDVVVDVAHNHTTFRVQFGPSLFVPDARTVLLVEYVTDLTKTNAVWPRLTPITLCPDPWLNIARAENQLLITWPTNLTQFTLESTSDFSDDTLWERVTNSVSSVYGLFTLRIDPVEARRFYRLHKLSGD